MFSGPLHHEEETKALESFGEGPSSSVLKVRRSDRGCMRDAARVTPLSLQKKVFLSQHSLKNSQHVEPLIKDLKLMGHVVSEPANHLLSSPGYIRTSGAYLIREKRAQYRVADHRTEVDGRDRY